MSELQAMERVELLPPGSVLFQQGRQPDGIYVIHSGGVDLVFSARNGVTKPLRTLHAGMIAGLSDAVSNAAHDCTATTRSSSHVGFVPIGDLNRLLAARPEVWLEIAAMLSVDLDDCWGRMRALAGAR